MNKSVNAGLKSYLKKLDAYMLAVMKMRRDYHKTADESFSAMETLGNSDWEYVNTNSRVLSSIEEVLGLTKKEIDKYEKIATEKAKKEVFG